MKNLYYYYYCTKRKQSDSQKNAVNQKLNCFNRLMLLVFVMLTSIHIVSIIYIKTQSKRVSKSINPHTIVAQKSRLKAVDTARTPIIRIAPVTVRALALARGEPHLPSPSNTTNPPGNLMVWSCGIRYYDISLRWRDGFLFRYPFEELWDEYWIEIQGSSVHWGYTVVW